uniref:Geraniol 10-hydroxylase n=1 Tax=Bacopa monnieri TaxID=263974 RepID=A0A8F2EFZ0_BACMN|nr:geraniol 10-hydroxylase [Bacopa monnieri]
MDFFTIVLVFLFSIFFIHGLNLLNNKRKKLPPGPTCLPILGNLHLLGDLPHKSLARLAKTYGPVMCLRFGQINTVVISSSSVAKEVLQKQDLAFSSRSIQDVGRAVDHSKYGLLYLPVSSTWRNMRKILNSNVFSGNSLDGSKEIRCRKVEELVESCKSQSRRGEAVDIGEAAFTTSLNLLSNTLFSKDLADPFSDSAKEFKDSVRKMSTEAAKPNLADFFPLLARFDPQRIRYRMTITAEKVLELFRGLVDERLNKEKLMNGHDDNHHEGKNDVLDVLLASKEIDRNNIEHLCLDLFVAGTDTTSGTVEWAMAEVLKNPDVMKKVKAELDEVIGKGKVIDEADISRLPYLRCVVKETLRLHAPVPFLVPRRVEQDVELCGYVVPKNTQVFVNAWAIARDAETWTSPLEFKPERFLDSEMDVRGRDFELIPFGAGRRICPGLPLAIRMVPVMLGSLLNCFDWKIDGGISAKDLDMEEKFGLTLEKAKHLKAVPIPL